MLIDNDRWMGSTEMIRLRPSFTASVSLDSDSSRRRVPSPLAHLQKGILLHGNLIRQQGSQALDLSFGIIIVSGDFTRW